ncbi:hypothetical protein E0E52_04640 [Azotobacter chroococcum]|nr:hypothetical protein E0E52_04640 [Azotobacter chroococcum]
MVRRGGQKGSDPRYRGERRPRSLTPTASLGEAPARSPRAGAFSWGLAESPVPPRALYALAIGLLLGLLWALVWYCVYREPADFRATNEAELRLIRE